MATRADMWLPSTPGAPGRGRVLAALVTSLLCHALVLLLVPDWRGGARPAPPLLVTMMEHGRGDDGEAGAAPAAAPAVAVPAAVAPVVAAPAPRAVAVARQRPAHPVAPRAAVVPALAPDAIVTAHASAAATSGASAPNGEAAAAAGGGTAGIGSGSGRGTSDGSGSDGLRAFCARCPTPEYPSRARRQGWQGTVDVALAIGGDGAVAEARVERSSGYPALDEVALDVARQSRFALPAGGTGLHGQLRYRFVLDATATRR